MLSDERVREAEKNFRSYLEEGLVRKAKPDERILKTYVKNSDESLKAAVELQNSAISNL